MSIMRGKKNKRRPYLTGMPELDKIIYDLSGKYCEEENRDLLNQILTTSMKLALESHNRADLKLVNVSFKQLRYALKIFSKYRDVRKVALFGSARTLPDSEEYRSAEDFSRKIVRHGFDVVTGAGGGIMEAGNKGAGGKHSIGVNIKLPFEQHANKYLTDHNKIINFKHFFVRKLFFIKETDATVLFPGGFGTLDEGLENLTLFQTGKSAPRPIVLLQTKTNKYWDEWMSFVKSALVKHAYISPDDLSLYYKTDDTDKAVEYITGFYKHYHSIRYIKEWTIFRLNTEIPMSYLKTVGKEFKNILEDGKIEPCGLIEDEKQKGEYLNLPRIKMKFNKREFGTLNKLIQRLNEY
ncbi:MAG: TIGR00730 family Rossman fold protein [bacterium]